MRQDLDLRFATNQKLLTFSFQGLSWNAGDCRELQIANDGSGAKKKKKKSVSKANARKSMVSRVETVECNKFETNEEMQLGP